MILRLSSPANMRAKSIAHWSKTRYRELACGLPRSVPVVPSGRIALRRLPSPSVKVFASAPERAPPGEVSRPPRPEELAVDVEEEVVCDGLVGPACRRPCMGMGTPGCRV